ncbi:MAG: cyclic nucleotide-binding domain-containing protein [Acidobacteriota bacterium]
MLKSIFGGKKKKSIPDAEDGELTIEDLITLERYDDAERELKKRLKMLPNDLHAHLRLAEVYTAQASAVKAMDEYVFVADSLASDGFFDKAVALLSKAAKIAPGDDTIPRRVERYRNLKRLEARRGLVIEGLLANPSTGVQTAGNTKLQAELLWNKLSKSHLVQELSGEQLKHLFAVMKMAQIADEQVLARRGQTLPQMVLIASGTVMASASVGGGQPMELRSFGTGDLIGDGALLEHKPWPADYQVVESGTVFILDRSGLEKAMIGQEDPRAFISVLRRQQNDRDVATSLAKLNA